MESVSALSSQGEGGGDSGPSSPGCRAAQCEGPSEEWSYWATGEQARSSKGWLLLQSGARAGTESKLVRGVH